MTIFENDHVIVLNKRAGYATQGGQDYEKNLFTLLISCYDRSAVHIMHRLDLPCSGVVVFAKSSEAARLIQPAITNRDTFHKFYLARVEGQPHPSSGLIDCNIEWNNNKKRARLSSPTIKDSQSALTYYKVLEANKESSLCLLKLITGRKHQLRCHLAQYLQTPIINDTLYGSTKRIASAGILLHSYALVIVRQDIAKMFTSDGPTQNQNGRIFHLDEKLVITANMNWKLEGVAPPNDQDVLREVQSLVSFAPDTHRRKKFVCY